MLAVLWYFYRKDNARFFDYLVFFTICALTSLCKGLLGILIPVLVILPTIKWREHLKPSLFIAFFIATIIYFIPFMLSGYHQSLQQVLHENFIRFFRPFDHMAPMYTYFIYLPIYTIPWAIFLPFTIYGYLKNYKNYTKNERWPIIATVIIFIFLTLSCSRRSYYILPAVPFAILAISIWLQKTINPKITKTLIIIFYISLAAFFTIIQPIYYLKHNQASNLAYKIRAITMQLYPWHEWHIQEHDVEDVVFYLKPQNAVTDINFNTLPHKTIWLAPKKYLPQIQQTLPKNKNLYIMLIKDDYIIVIWR
jgi:4-amino-4-deoxy-L-arabinose transferase-like glycosyltransferase